MNNRALPWFLVGALAVVVLVLAAFLLRGQSTVAVIALATDAPTRTATPIPVTGKWIAGSGTLSLSADAAVVTTMGSVRPVLLVRCAGEQWHAFVNADTPLDVSADGMTPIRYQVDGNPVVSVSGKTQADKIAALPDDLIATMKTHQRLAVTLRYFMKDDLVMSFTLTGFGAATCK